MSLAIIRQLRDTYGVNGLLRGDRLLRSHLLDKSSSTLIGGYYPRVSWRSGVPHTVQDGVFAVSRELTTFGEGKVCGSAS